jgi:purine nucleoside phosphorylase
MPATGLARSRGSTFADPHLAHEAVHQALERLGAERARSVLLFLTGHFSRDPAPAIHAAARAEGVELTEGVYAGLLGPQYETPSEVRMLRTLGADAVGMSTVLECIAARWAGLEVCGVSLVTNAGAGYTGEPLSHEEVMAAGAEAGPRVARVIRRFVADL